MDSRYCSMKGSLVTVPEKVLAREKAKEKHSQSEKWRSTYFSCMYAEMTLTKVMTLITVDTMAEAFIAKTWKRPRTAINWLSSLQIRFWIGRNSPYMRRVRCAALSGNDDSRVEGTRWTIISMTPHIRLTKCIQERITQWYSSRTPEQRSSQQATRPSVWITTTATSCTTPSATSAHINRWWYGTKIKWPAACDDHSARSSNTGEQLFM